jgi:hypothetical protein
MERFASIEVVCLLSVSEKVLSRAREFVWARNRTPRVSLQKGEVFNFQ